MRTAICTNTVAAAAAVSAILSGLSQDTDATDLMDKFVGSVWLKPDTAYD